MAVATARYPTQRRFHNSAADHWPCQSFRACIPGLFRLYHKGRTTETALGHTWTTGGIVIIFIHLPSSGLWPVLAHRVEPFAVAQNTNPQTSPSRYVVGFDLGTTNSAVCYVDTAEEPWRVRTFAVPQLVAPAQVEARETLPSFHYQPAPGELPPEALRLPWQHATEGQDRAKRDNRGERCRTSSASSPAITARWCPAG